MCLCLFVCLFGRLFCSSVGCLFVCVCFCARARVAVSLSLSMCVSICLFVCLSVILSGCVYSYVSVRVRWFDYVCVMFVTYFMLFVIFVRFCLVLLYPPHYVAVVVCSLQTRNVVQNQMSLINMAGFECVTFACKHANVFWY